MNANLLTMLAVSDSGFVFDPRTGHSYTVNATGLTLLQQLKQGCSLAECQEYLKHTFDATGDVQSDVLAFMHALTAYGLVGSDASKGSAV